MSKEEDRRKKYNECEAWIVKYQRIIDDEVIDFEIHVFPFERYPFHGNKYGWELIEQYESESMGVDKIKVQQLKDSKLVDELIKTKRGKPPTYTNPQVQDLMRDVRGHPITYEYFQKIVPSKDSEGYSEIELSYELKKYKERKYRKLDEFKEKHDNKEYEDELQQLSTIIKYLIELIQIRKEERIELKGNHKPELNRKKSIVTDEIINLKRKRLGADKKEMKEIEKKIQTLQKYRKQMG